MIVCMPRTVAGGRLKRHDFRRRRGFEERQPVPGGNGGARLGACAAAARRRCAVAEELGVVVLDLAELAPLQRAPGAVQAGVLLRLAARHS